MLEVTVGHEVDCSIVYLDQNGNPMQTTPTPDAAPVWTNTPGTSPVDNMVVAADGSSAAVTTLAAGADTVSVSVVVGGNTYTASLQLQIDPAPQVLTSVSIATTVK